MGFDGGFEDEVEVAAVGDYGEGNCDGDREECETHLAEVEVVDVDVDEGEDFEEPADLMTLVPQVSYSLFCSLLR